MDVGLTILSTALVTAGVFLVVWYAGGLIFQCKKKFEASMEFLNKDLESHKKLHETEFVTFSRRIESFFSRILELEKKLRGAQVVRIEPKTGAFLHTPESEAAAEQEAGIGEPIQIGAAKRNGARHEFATLGGVDAFDKPTMEEVSDNAGKEAERTRQGQ